MTDHALLISVISGHTLLYTGGRPRLVDKCYIRSLCYIQVIDHVLLISVISGQTLLYAGDRPRLVDKCYVRSYLVMYR